MLKSNPVLSMGYCSGVAQKISTIFLHAKPNNTASVSNRKSYKDLFKEYFILTVRSLCVLGLSNFIFKNKGKHISNREIRKVKY